MLNIIGSLPENTSGPIFLLSADLDQVQNSNYKSVQISVNIDKRVPGNSISLNLIKDPNNYWKIECANAKGNV